MDMNPYLTFNGTCAEAFSFYAGLMGGEVLVVQTFGEAPDPSQFPPEMLGKAMHAQVRLGERILMGSDDTPEHYKAPQGFHIQTGWDSEAEAQRVFDRLARGGEVIMPFARTFWAVGFGMCRDRYGVPWMVNCEVEG